MSSHRSTFVRTAVAAALLSASIPALAQSATPGGDQQVKSTDDTAKDAAATPPSDADRGDIVVTGSRVVTNGNNSPTTVAIVTTNQLTQTTPNNLSDGLIKLPQFAGSSTQVSNNNIGGAFSSNSFLNLRSVGPVRNLVLFDGMRLAPSTTSGAVDVYTIPQLLVERVDVVTGGVSAVYGSDAVSGVVNFIIDKRFNGFKGVAQAGISERGDNASQRLGFAVGTPFAGGRGHVEGSFEYYNSDGIPNNKSRPNGAARYTATGAGTTANPFTLTQDSRLGSLSFGGHILATYNAAGAFTPSTFLDTNFSTNGVLTPFQHGAATGTAGTEMGGEGGFYESTLLSTLTTKQGYLRADYELTDSIRFHAQGFGAESRSRGVYIQPLFTPRLSATNGFLTTAQQSAFAAAGVSQFSIFKFSEYAPRVTQDVTIRSLLGNVGFDGDIGSKFDWTLNYGHNETRRTDILRGNLSNARTFAAVDAVVAPASYTGSDYLTNSQGQRVVCNVTLTNPGLYPGCLPLNLFGPTAEDPRALAYVRNDTRNVLTQKLDTVSAAISGALFSLPAGDVRVAINGELRWLSLRGVSESQPTTTIDCTGLRFNCSAASTEYRLAVTADSYGRENVKEIGGELLIPLLKDAPFARSLSLNGAARYTDYRTSGGVATWKAGLDWHPTDFLSFRGTRSRDIRAPTVTELFGAEQRADSGFADIQTNSSGITNFRVGGNPDLLPEKADTYTIGGVFKPGFLPGFSVAVDYFNIRINNAVTAIDGRDPTYQRQCIDSGYTSSICSLYVRPISPSDTTAANYPTVVYARNINIATLRTQGVDIDLIYNAEFFGGNWNFRALGTYQPKFTLAVSPTAPLLNQAGADGLPKYRVTGFVGYTNGPISIATQTTFHSPTRHSSNPAIVYAYGNTPSRAFTDLTLSFDIPTRAHSSQFFVTVNNLFDTSGGVYPAPIASVPGFGTIVTNGDDPVGRYFTAGVRARF